MMKNEQLIDIICLNKIFSVLSRMLYDLPCFYYVYRFLILHTNYL